MNTKLELFLQYFSEGFPSPGSDSEILAFMLFEGFSDEEKRIVLNHFTQEELHQFLRKWASGVQIPGDIYERLTADLDRLSSDLLVLGDKTRAKEFILREFNEIQAEEILQCTERISPKNKSVLFETLLSISSETIYVLLKEEDEMLIASLLQTWKENIKTHSIYERMRSYFPSDLPTVVRKPKRDVFKNIERVLERQIALYQSEY